MINVIFILLLVVQIYGQSQEYCDRYWFSYPKLAYWLDAIDACRQRGSQWELVSVQNAIKQAEIDDYLLFSNAAWLLSDALVWTSGHRRQNQFFDKFLWIDRLETITFSQWDDKEPQLENTNANIALRINATIGDWRWRAVKEELVKAYYICERKVCVSDRD